MRGPDVLNRLLDSSALTERGVEATTLGVSDGNDALDFGTYADMVARACGLLVGLGVERGDRVGVHLHKSVDAFVAVHAVLRAGAVMVPLDPLAPIAHIHDLVVDAGASALFTDVGGEELEWLIEGTEVRGIVQRIVRSRDGGESLAGVIVVGWDELHGTDPVPAVAVEPDDPAYIIYTSGTTGVPKGIVHTHRSAFAYVEMAATTYGLRSTDRLVNVAGLHFDQSTFELYAAPLVGAASIVVPDPVLRFPASIAQLIERERATVWYSVPFVLRQLAARGVLDQRDLSHLRWVLFGGEAYPPDELATIMALMPNARFSNVYGPAEVNQCTYHHLDRPPRPDEPVPIGTAWAAADVAVVDDELIPVRNGDAGELLVASTTLMAGYWRQPELTSTSIIDDGMRWYRTGDRVRVDDAGELMFLGRVDNQVKVRGNRVELEAVDAALVATDGVRDGGVAVDDSGDISRLVAAVVLESGCTIRAITRDLSSRLPAGAVPSIIIAVETMLRTTNGKVDREAIVNQVAERDHPDSPARHVSESDQL